MEEMKMDDATAAMLMGSAMSQRRRKGGTNGITPAELREKAKRRKNRNRNRIARKSRRRNR